MIARLSFGAMSMTTLKRLAVLTLLCVFAFGAVPSAQTTLPTTTLSAALAGPPGNPGVNITLASVGSGATQLRVGWLLFVDWEAIQVLSCGTVTATNAVCSSTSVVGQRGSAGTRPAPHISGAAVTYGPASSSGPVGGFQTGPPPLGRCTRANYLFLPWIDLTTGNQWTCDSRASALPKWTGANIAVLAYNSTIDVGTQ